MTIHDHGRCFVYDCAEGDAPGRCQFVPVARRWSILPVFGHYSFYPSDEYEFEAYRGAVDAARFLAAMRDEDEAYQAGEGPPPQPFSLPRGDAEPPPRRAVAEVLPWSGDDDDPSEDVA